MQQVALFKLEDKFHITGRGIVIAGQIVEGHIASGNAIYFDGQKPLKILGVEFGHGPKNSFVGLLIDVPTKESELEFERLIGQTLKITA